MQAHWLGRVDYLEALAQQEALVERKIADRAVPDELLLLEHQPVYTMGRTPDQSSLGDPAALPHPLVRINRGGQATYHGPGQLVGYPVLDLRPRGQDLHKYLRALEKALLALLAELDLPAQRREALTGVWIEDRKIASIGVGVRRWVTMHGFALNVYGDLAPFARITPCGIAGVTMTSIAAETGRNDLSVELVAGLVVPHLLQTFGELEVVEPGPAKPNRVERTCFALRFERSPVPAGVWW